MSLIEIGKSLSSYDIEISNTSALYDIVSLAGSLIKDTVAVKKVNLIEGES